MIGGKFHDKLDVFKGEIFSETIMVSYDTPYHAVIVCAKYTDTGKFSFLPNNSINYKVLEEHGLMCGWLN